MESKELFGDLIDKMTGRFISEHPHSDLSTEDCRSSVESMLGILSDIIHEMIDSAFLNGPPAIKIMEGIKQVGPYPYTCWECNVLVKSFQPYCLPGKLCKACSLELHK